MKPFDYLQPKSLQEAVGLLGPDVRPLAGGTDLLEMVKDGLTEPHKLVGLKRIPGLSYIQESSGGLRIGATTTLQQIAESDAVKQAYPALAQAALAVASPQIRNMGTLGGNLCQRVRCWYYRLPQCTDCYKRGGSYCYAPFGESTVHAVFDSAACFAVHPSDTAVALEALGASIVIAGPGGKQRTVAAGDFFTGPEVDYMRENVLAPNEVVAEVQLPAPASGQRSVFLKAATRHAIDFALTSVAAVVVGSPSVQRASIVLGAVAPTPRRSTAAEAYLAGKALQPDVIGKAADLAVQDARPLAYNAFKVDLARGLVRQALAGFTS